MSTSTCIRVLDDHAITSCSCDEHLFPYSMCSQLLLKNSQVDCSLISLTLTLPPFGVIVPHRSYPTLRQDATMPCVSFAILLHSTGAVPAGADQSQWQSGKPWQWGGVH